jgi:hypothetical protein
VGGRLCRYHSPRVQRQTEERSSIGRSSVVPGASKRVRLPRADFGSRYGKSATGKLRNRGRSGVRSHRRETGQNEFKNGVCNCGLSP